ncbi:MULTISPECIES: hypothetical protein [Prauserella salsuginis group]|uniref:Transposase n=2 Tax=Prauserella salsuginis group TaxID=2893672 RepID=A0A839XL90_9PSEU|nr:MULTISPECIES: hypothetical protein [Prauserella salsuginis group]MBB3662599.1 hypothetical protein [Prauserella sediminis]MCR3720304.1 hypothetical protein [Prauserella flava]MCR3733988.1 hypothetical protein [Prauserella salsuginis]
MTEHGGQHSGGPHPNDDERAELEWLRVENQLLRTQRDVLERIATGFAEDLGIAWPGAAARPDGSPRGDTR